MSRKPLREKCVLVALLILLGASYALFLSFPASLEPGNETIKINPWRGNLYLFMLATSLVAAVVSAWIARRRTKAGWFVFATAVVSPLFCCGGLIGDLGGFVDESAIRDRDGTEYHLLASHFLQGSELAIGRLRRHTGLWEEFQVIVTSPWEESFGLLSVVRPQGSTDDPRLYLTRKRLLVGLPQSNMAFLAYDLNEGKPYGMDGSGKRVVADIRSLSPFMLLDTGDAPQESDFQTLLDPTSYGRPKPKAVEPDSQNADPKVRGLARRLIANLRTYPPRR